jgi:5,10-methylenetetrahydrofolate reductase
VASLLDALRTETSIVAAELRPPRAALGAREGIDAWIDTYHAVRRLTRQGGWVFLTDSAVGLREEDTLRHLAANLGRDVPRDHIVPFLTAKHPLQHCLSSADRAVQHGFPALVVLGGDKTVGPPRCVQHAWQLREAIRVRQPELHLGGWANPHGDVMRQAEYLLDGRTTADFFLTQIVSHHQLPGVERFLRALDRTGVNIPGVFGVFYYRSANPRTLRELADFLPVPADELSAEFQAGATADDVCARTLDGLRGLGIRHIYVSNLPLGRASQTIGRLASLQSDTKA